MTLLVSLMLAALLLALSMGLVVITNIESAVAANAGRAIDALYAADAGIELAVSRLTTAADWSAELASELPGCAGPEGAAVAATGFYPEDRWEADSPVWRLYACTPMRDLLPSDAAASGFVVAVWVADDVSEADGDPLADTNGTLTLRAEAHGPLGAHAAAEATVARSGPEVRTLSRRVLR